MEEEPIGWQERKQYALPEPAPAEQSDKPEPSLPQTNWMGKPVIWKHLVITHATTFVLSLIILSAHSIRESAEISSVRADQQAAAKAILDRINESDRAARERSEANRQRAEKINENGVRMISKMDTLIQQLSAQDKKP